MIQRSYFPLVIELNSCIGACCISVLRDLKDTSGVGIIVDYSRDYTVVNGV